MYLLDTSALLRGERDGKILVTVIEELDNLKTKEGRIGKDARRVLKYIYKYAMDQILDEGETIRNCLNTDDALLAMAESEDLILLTADLSLFLQAKGRDIPCEYMNGKSTEHLLESTTTYITGEEYADILLGDYEGDYPENHFLIFEDEAYRIVGGRPKAVKYRTINNQWVGEIKPRNVEQKCLIDLMSSNTPVVAVHSKYGCGKSYLMLNHMLEMIDKAMYEKIIVVPNNSVVAGSRDVGILPGDLLEKEFVFLGPMIDLLGKAEVMTMVEYEQLEVAPIAFTRGRSWEDAIILVSEAQNLTEYHVKLLLSRVGEGSKIFFDGDVRQEDNAAFTNSSGLTLLHKLSNSSEARLFGSVELKTIERSKVARLADVLDRMEE